MTARIRRWAIATGSGTAADRPLAGKSVRWWIPPEHACYAYVSGSVVGAINESWSSSAARASSRSRRTSSAPIVSKESASTWAGACSSSAQASGGAARRAECVAFGPSSQRTNGTTHPMQGTGRLRLTGLTPLAPSQSTTSLSQIGSDWCTMNRWAVLGSNTCLTSHPQFCL